MLSYFSSFQKTHALLKISGPDPLTFLQGQLTCDVREVTNQTSRLAAYCNPKGRVLATLRVFLYQAYYYLSLPLELSEFVQEKLARVGALSEMTVSQELELKHFGLLTNLPDFPSTEPNSTLLMQEYLLIRTFGKEARFEGIGPSRSFSEIAASLGIPNFSEMTAKAWKDIDIQEKVVTIYPETSGLFTPDMIDYPTLQAVSLKKGCYVGQEIIARTHYLGQSKRELALFQDTQLLPRGASILREGVPVGTVVDSCQIGEKYWILSVMD